VFMECVRRSFKFEMTPREGTKQDFTCARTTHETQTDQAKPLRAVGAVVVSYV